MTQTSPIYGCRKIILKCFVKKTFKHFPVIVGNFSTVINYECKTFMKLAIVANVTKYLWS
jgi:hypothetical protein